MALKKVQRTSVSDQAYDILVKKITNGEWKAGEKIPAEIELAKQLGISRVSLKIALQKLNTLGVTETRVGEGTFVCDFSLKSLFSELFRSNIFGLDHNKINEFRVLIEYCAMRLAVLNPPNPAALARLNEVLASMAESVQSGDDDTYHNLHYNFHRLICEMGKNELFLQLYDSISEVMYDTLRANSEMTWNHFPRSESIQHHRELLEALEQRDLARLTKVQDDLLLDQYLRS